jgi:hypothetical protein
MRQCLHELEKDKGEKYPPDGREAPKRGQTVAATYKDQSQDSQGDHREGCKEHVVSHRVDRIPEGAVESEDRAP